MSLPEYEQLTSRMSEVLDLRGVLSLLDWDQETYMPPKGLHARSRQLKTISSLLHEKQTDAQIGRLLDALEQSANQQRLNPIEQSAVREIRYDFERARKLPTSLVAQLAEATSLAMVAWTKAREAKDFSLFADDLKHVVDLLRQKAASYGFEESPYDALIEDFERGMTASKIRPIFARLRASLTPLIQQLSQSPRRPRKEILSRHFDPQKQWEFSIEVLKAMGFDLEAGRQDKSAHPFTSGTHPTDIRLTTRIYGDYFSAGLFSTMHEGGHGLYEQGFPATLIDTVLAAAPSLGLHESQSRLWENQIGRSRAFWRHYYPTARQFFPEALGDIAEEEFYGAINTVEPSFIRVEADEATYPLHIILRFELEHDLIDGRIEVDQLPALWNAKMQELLGITPPDDALGVLQDIHWSHGLVGYFPTYALGNLYSAQIFKQMRSEIGDLDEAIARGELHVVRDYLARHIYSAGRTLLADEVIQKVCGEGLNEKPFLEYVARKFGAIYDL